MDKKDQIEYINKVAKVKKELLSCANKNCKLVVKNYKTILKNLSKELKKAWKDYELNKIKEKQLLSILISILKKNVNSIQYTNYIKCLIKNCYKNYKHYMDLAFLSLRNAFIQKIILIKAKEYNIEKEVMKFLNSINDQPTFKKIKLSAKAVIEIMEKLYNSNEALIVKTIKENKKEISNVFKQIEMI